MPIFFGWGRQTTWNVGPVFQQLCSHCNNDDYWVLTRRITWFTLFFIPIIPYNIKYIVTCPTCEYGIQLDGKKFEEMRVIAENNTALINGIITPAQYKYNINQNSAPSTVLNNGVNQIVSVSDGKCTNCNNTNTKNSKFCKNCGQRL